MGRLQDVPVETVEAICRALSSKTDLVQFSSTCRYLHEAAAPMVWRHVHLVFTNEAVLQRTLMHALASDNHPAFSHTTRLSIDTPGLIYVEDVTSHLVAWTDQILTELLKRMSLVKHVEVDFCMALHPFPALVDYLFGTQDHLQFLNVVGLYSTELALTARKPLLRGLRIGYSGCQLHGELSAFPNLAHLHLELDCRNYKDHPSHFLNFPPSIWSHLKTFSLESPEGYPGSKAILSTLEDSLGQAGTVVIEGLAVFWSLDADDYRRALSMLSRNCPRLVKLAWTFPDYPEPAFFRLLGGYLPGLKELTCCVFMHQGAWRWPESAERYAEGFSGLRKLRTLALNNYEAQEETGGDSESYTGGKYTPECTEQAAKARLHFALEVAKSCSKLRNMVFCPVDHERSYVTVLRYSENARGVTFVPAGPRLFWQGID